MLMGSQRIPRVVSLIAPEVMAQIRKHIGLWRGCYRTATRPQPRHNPASTATAYLACFAPFAIGRGRGVLRGVELLGLGRAGQGHGLRVRRDRRGHPVEVAGADL